MKKSLTVLLVALLSAGAVATATPQTQFNRGEFQIDIGAWSPMANISRGTGFSHSWDFAGGLTYGLSDKLALQYQYWGLKSKSRDYSDHSDLSGQQHEVNLLYSLSPKIAAYTGYSRIHFSKSDADGPYDSNDTNSVAQIGVIAKTSVAKNLDIYAKGALGTHKTSLWEAGLGYSFTPDLDFSMGYRHLDTDRHSSVHDSNGTFQGMIAMLSYRFGAPKAQK